MEKTLSRLRSKFPELQFVAGGRFSWSPETRQIFYDEERRDRKANWSLLHETGHALLDHKNYLADFELLRMEMAAWAKARQLGADLQIKIDENHIQDCLDTYRDWLYKRSICPHCATKALQQNDYIHYRCHNCRTVWSVSPSRFARAYRSTKKIPAGAEIF